VRLDAEHDFDVAHHLNWGSLFWGSTLSRLGKPFVFGPIGGGQTSPEVLREWFGESWRREAQRNWALRVALRFNPRARRTIRAADLVLATNSETAARSRALGATRVELCLDTAVLSEAIAHEEREAPGRSAPTVLWVGRNLPRKGVALALHAFAQVHRSVPSAQLVMLGGGLDDAATTAQIEALGLVGAVHRLGQVPLPVVIDRYDTSSVMLFSSLRESSGAQVFEAMSRGLPVVALDVHGVGDFMPAAAGVKVPLQQGEGLADALGEGVVQLLTEPALWQEASRAARAAAGQHTWDRRAQDLARHFAGWPRRVAQVGRVRIRTPETPVAEDYEALNAALTASETDFSTSLYRHAQFARHFGSAMRILDVGCNNGRGGVVLRQAKPSAHIEGLEMLAARAALVPAGVYDAVTVGDLATIAGAGRSSMLSSWGS
jgi:glycosyltransferase involved in cell wall biosynthesis